MNEQWITDAAQACYDLSVHPRFKRWWSPTVAGIIIKQEYEQREPVPVPPPGPEPGRLYVTRQCQTNGAVVGAIPDDWYPDIPRMPYPTETFLGDDQAKWPEEIQFAIATTEKHSNIIDDPCLDFESEAWVSGLTSSDPIVRTQASDNCVDALDAGASAMWAVPDVYWHIGTSYGINVPLDTRYMDVVNASKVLCPRLYLWDTTMTPHWEDWAATVLASCTRLAPALPVFATLAFRTRHIPGTITDSQGYPTGKRPGSPADVMGLTSYEPITLDAWRHAVRYILERGDNVLIWDNIAYAPPPANVNDLDPRQYMDAAVTVEQEVRA